MEDLGIQLYLESTGSTNVLANSKPTRGVGVLEPARLPQGTGDRGDLGSLGNQPGIFGWHTTGHSIELVTFGNL